jgi:hypothetical protein
LERSAAEDDASRNPNAPRTFSLANLTLLRSTRVDAASRSSSVASANAFSGFANRGAVSPNASSAALQAILHSVIIDEGSAFATSDDAAAATRARAGIITRNPFFSLIASRVGRRRLRRRAPPLALAEDLGAHGVHVRSRARLFVFLRGFQSSQPLLFPLLLVSLGAQRASRALERRRPPAAGLRLWKRERVREVVSAGISCFDAFATRGGRGEGRRAAASGAARHRETRCQRSQIRRRRRMEPRGGRRRALRAGSRSVWT